MPLGVLAGIMEGSRVDAAIQVFNLAGLSAPVFWVGLMLLVGFTGQISLGHAAFLAIGAYTEALLQARGVPFAVVLTSGFAEAGEEGRRAQLELAHSARECGIEVAATPSDMAEALLRAAKSKGVTLS